MEHTKVEKLKNFLVSYVDILVRDGGCGTVPNLPSFELRARDYLNFAEDEINRNTPSSLINCISSLKRAIDCQLDTFLYSFNLYNVFSSRNLKFEKKLEFLKACGIFSSRSLGRLNTIRNKMEHDYEIPKIEDIEVYYDLVAAFVAILEETILALNLNNELFFVFNEEYGPNGSFSIKYNFNKPSLITEWILRDSGDVQKEEIEVTIENYNEFAYIFKILLLLYLSEGNIRKEFFISMIKDCS